MTHCLHCDKPTPERVLARRGGYCQDCELLTPEQVWAMLGVSRSTYFRMVKAKRIHPRHITPGTVRVPRADIDAILKGVPA